MHGGARLLKPKIIRNRGNMCILYAAHGQHFQQRDGMDQAVMVANPARGHLRARKMFFSLSPLSAPKNLVSRDWFGRLVSRLILHTQSG